MMLFERESKFFTIRADGAVGAGAKSLIRGELVQPARNLLYLIDYAVVSAATNLPSQLEHGTKKDF